MSFISKLFILAMVAYVHASPRISQAEGEGGSVWSKFLGKVPEYFKGPENVNELQTSNQAAAAAATSDVQNDEIVNDGGSSYPNPSQLTENNWREQFEKCMKSNYEQISSGSGGSGGNGGSGGSGGNGGSGDSSSQYGSNQLSNYASSESFNSYMKKCREQVTASFGQYPGMQGQDFFSQYKPQLPSNFGSYTGALTGSSPSSSSSPSA